MDRETKLQLSPFSYKMLKSIHSSLTLECQGKSRKATQQWGRHGALSFFFSFSLPNFFFPPCPTHPPFGMTPPSKSQSKSNHFKVAASLVHNPIPSLFLSLPLKKSLSTVLRTENKRFSMYYFGFSPQVLSAN